METQAAIAEHEAQFGGSLAGKYLTFNLGQEQYGISILRVEEIIGMMAITPVPKSPHYIKGVINLRGKVIPVVDLRLKVGLPETEQTERTCIIVVELKKDDGLVQMGIVVDSVSEVVDIRDAEIEPTPALGSDIDTDFILGMAKAEDKVRALLDLDRLLGMDQSFPM